MCIRDRAEALLRAAPWRGNVREVRNLVERLALLREEGDFVIDAADLEAVGVRPRARTAAAGSVATEVPFGDRTYRELVDDFERSLLTAALAKANGNVAGAARLL